MKLFLTLAIFWCSVAYAQHDNCIWKKTNCPNAEDSLLIYKNAVMVNDFFENNKIYIKIRVKEIKSIYDKREIYSSLQHARSFFTIIRNDSSLKNHNDPDNLKPNPKYIDITYDQYYQKMDKFRFYQRELENQIINTESPMSLYDVRICPFLINEYKCIDSSSVYFGDVVNIPMYIPLLVKPFASLTSEERLIRKNILEENNSKNHINPESVLVEEKDVNNKKSNMQITPKGVPVYMYDNKGSASIIGFTNNRDFIKIKPEQYDAFVVQEYARELLSNEYDFERWIKTKYGGYFRTLK